VPYSQELGRFEGPIAVIDNDGQVEIVVAHNNLLGTVHGLTVVGDMAQSWRPGRKIWNQHAYSITNVDDDGGVPAQPTPNWPQYNNFRSGDLSPADGLVAPDLEMLTPEACVNDCTADLLNVWVQLGNTGAGPLLAGATVDVYGTPMGMLEVLLTTVDVPLALAPGEFADAISIPIDLTDLEQIRLVATPKETECKVDMANEIVILPPFCPSPG